MNFTMGSLFAGIGGFDLGFERAGFRTEWQVEIDPYCQAKYFRSISPMQLTVLETSGNAADITSSPLDVICGGFPLPRDISNAGLRAGIDGERSGLWSEYARIIRRTTTKLRPRGERRSFAWTGNWPRVLGDLAAIGYDAEVGEIISALKRRWCSPPPRARYGLLAYPVSERYSGTKTIFNSGSHEEWDGATRQQSGRAEPRTAFSGCRSVGLHPGRTLRRRRGNIANDIRSGL